MPCGLMDSLELGDVFGEVVYHEFGVLYDDVSNDAVVRRLLHLQLLFRLPQPNSTLNYFIHLKR